MLYTVVEGRVGGRASSEICIIQQPNSITVLLFIQNISKFLTRLPPGRLSSKLWSILRHGFRILKDVFSGSEIILL